MRGCGGASPLLPGRPRGLLGRKRSRGVPGATYSRTSGVDAHHNLYRYTWAIHQGSKLLLPGFDVVEADQSGRVARVLGFFGPLPEKEV